MDKLVNELLTLLRELLAGQDRLLLSMPMPPTSKDALDTSPGVPSDQYVSPTAPNAPDVPQSRQAYSPHTATSPSSYSQADEMRQRNEMAEHPAFAPPAQVPKAFATARPFSSGVSPWMGLFRNDTNGGTIDNYSTQVRPALDQRSLNQQFNMDVYGLQRNAQIQNAALQQLNNRANSRAPQVIGTPQFYQNGGGYPYGAGGYGQGYGQGGYGQ